MFVRNSRRSSVSNETLLVDQGRPALPYESRRENDVAFVKLTFLLFRDFRGNSVSCSNQLERFW
jgi:hypothetical protein